MVSLASLCHCWPVGTYGSDRGYPLDLEDGSKYKYTHPHSPPCHQHTGRPARWRRKGGWPRRSIPRTPHQHNGHVTPGLGCSTAPKPAGLWGGRQWNELFTLILRVSWQSDTSWSCFCQENENLYWWTCFQTSHQWVLNIQAPSGNPQQPPRTQGKKHPRMPVCIADRSLEWGLASLNLTTGALSMSRIAPQNRGS